MHRAVMRIRGSTPYGLQLAGFGVWRSGVHGPSTIHFWQEHNFLPHYCIHACMHACMQVERSRFTFLLSRLGAREPREEVFRLSEGHRENTPEIPEGNQWALGTRGHWGAPIAQARAEKERLRNPPKRGGLEISESAMYYIKGEKRTRVGYYSGSPVIPNTSYQDRVFFYSASIIIINILSSRHNYSFYNTL